MRLAIFAFTMLPCLQMAAAEPQVVTTADDGKTFTLSVGQCLDVRLSTQAASTGYQWYLAPGMSEVMSLAARTVTTPGDAPPGAPSQLDYILCAASPGSTVVRFLNYRTWEKNVLPAKALSLTVKITR